MAVSCEMLETTEIAPTYERLLSAIERILSHHEAAASMWFCPQHQSQQTILSLVVHAQENLFGALMSLLGPILIATATHPTTLKHL